MLTPKPLKEASFFQKLFNKPNEANALIEINNFLFEQSGNFISVEQILKFLEKYKINLYKWKKSKKAELFELFYLYNLHDKKFTEKESNELRTLKKIISLDDEKIYAIQAKVVADVYEKTIDEVLSDYSISEDERKYLEGVRAKLSIPKNAAQQLFKESAKDIVEEFTAKMIKDRALSPKEEKLAFEVAQTLGVNLKHISNINQLRKYKLFWKIENGQMPNLRANINLTSSEICHHIESIDWFEYRSVIINQEDIDYSNQIELARNNYQSDERIKIEKKEELTYINSGKLYITNKRIIYVAENNIIAYHLDEIGKFKVYKDGIDIYITNGSFMFWEIRKNVDLFALIMQTAYNNHEI